MTGRQCTPEVMQRMGIVSKLVHSQHVHYAEPMLAVLLQALQTKWSSPSCRTLIVTMVHLTEPAEQCNTVYTVKIEYGSPDMDKQFGCSANGSSCTRSRSNLLLPRKLLWMSHADASCNTALLLRCSCKLKTVRRAYVCSIAALPKLTHSQ